LTIEFNGNNASAQLILSPNYDLLLYPHHKTATTKKPLLIGDALIYCRKSNIYLHSQ